MAQRADAAAAGSARARGLFSAAPSVPAASLGHPHLLPGDAWSEGEGEHEEEAGNETPDFTSLRQKKPRVGALPTRLMRDRLRQVPPPTTLQEAGAEFSELDRGLTRMRHELREERALADRVERRRLKSVLFADPTVHALYELCRIAAGTMGVEAWDTLWTPDRDAVLLSDHRNVFARSAAQYRRLRGLTNDPAEARGREEDRTEAQPWFAVGGVLELQHPSVPSPDTYLYRNVALGEDYAQTEDQTTYDPYAGVDKSVKRKSTQRPTHFPWVGDWSGVFVPAKDRTSSRGAQQTALTSGVLAGNTLHQLIGHHLPWDEKWPLLRRSRMTQNKVMSRLVPQKLAQVSADDWAFYALYGSVLSDPMVAALQNVMGELRRVTNDQMRYAPIVGLIKTELLRTYLGRWVGYTLMLSRALGGKQWIRREALNDLEELCEECRRFFARPSELLTASLLMANADEHSGAMAKLLEANGDGDGAAGGAGRGRGAAAAGRGAGAAAGRGAGAAAAGRGAGAAAGRGAGAGPAAGPGAAAAGRGAGPAAGPGAGAGRGAGAAAGRGRGARRAGRGGAPSSPSSVSSAPAAGSSPPREAPRSRAGGAAARAEAGDDEGAAEAGPEAADADADDAARPGGGGRRSRVRAGDWAIDDGEASNADSEEPEPDAAASGPAGYRPPAASAKKLAAAWREVE